MMRKSLISISLAFTLSFGAVGEESVLLADILANSTEQIKKINDQIKLITDTIDQIDKVNNALDKIDYLIFESGEKLFNPKQTLERIVNKFKNLQERFEAYPDKFQNGFGYDRFFKDYHNITCRTEWSGEEIEAFKKIEKQTGIKIEELKVRKCIEENLTNPQNKEDTESLLKVDEYVRNKDYASALAELEKIRKNRIVGEMSKNTEIMNSAKVLNDVFMHYNSKDKNNERQIDKIRNQIKDITSEIANNKNPDLQGSLSNLNALMVNLLTLTEKIYTSQIAYYKAYNDFQIALYGRKQEEPKEIDDYKKNGKQGKTKAFYEDLLEHPKVKYDEFGYPIF